MTGLRRALIVCTAAAAFASVAVTAFAAGNAQPPSSSAAPSVRSCGRHTIAGKKWTIIANRLTCPTAVGVVSRLATKKVPPTGQFPGKYAGMKCISTSRPGTKPKYIGCAKQGGYSLTALQGL